MNFSPTSAIYSAKIKTRSEFIDVKGFELEFKNQLDAKSN